MNSGEEWTLDEVPCDEPCDGMKEYLKSRDSFRAYVLDPGEECPFYLVALDTDREAVLNVGAVVWATENLDEAHEVREALNEGRVPIGALARLASALLSEAEEEGYEVI